MKLLLITILLVCFTYGVFASPFGGYEAENQLMHRFKRSHCPDRAEAERSRCSYCGCPGKDGQDVCTNIRCAFVPESTKPPKSY